MSTRDLTDLVYDEMHATRWDLADWELRELAQTAAGVFRSHPCDHEAQIRDLLEEREELLTEIRRLRGDGLPLELDEHFLEISARTRSGPFPKEKP